MNTASKYFKKFALLSLILLAGCSADLGTKKWSENTLMIDGPVNIIPDYFDLYYVENTAIAFSFLHSLPDSVRMPLILTLSMSSTLLLGFLIWNWREKTFSQILPLFLVLAGAFGNIIDRIANGYVVDFLYFHWADTWSFPVFNVADIMVTCGVILLFLQSLLGKNEIAIEDHNKVATEGDVPTA